MLLLGGASFDSPENQSLILKISSWNSKEKIVIMNCEYTSHSAYVATSTESNGVKIDGFLYPNYM